MKKFKKLLLYTTLIIISIPTFAFACYFFYMIFTWLFLGYIFSLDRVILVPMLLILFTLISVGVIGFIEGSE